MKTRPDDRFNNLPESFPYRGTDLPPTGHPHWARPGDRGRYLPGERLVRAVNTALIVEQPLLVTGEPGCGKTCLAWSVATELGLDEPLVFNTSSDSLAADLFYRYDHLRRLFDAQAQGPHRALPDPRLYVTTEALGEAIRSRTRRVVLIDEIDKAPRDFPNSLLDPLEQMTFRVKETGEVFTTDARPVVIITSNRESRLPEPFLRRCVYHHIEQPGPAELREILQERLGHLHLPEQLVATALARFLELRKQDELDRRPAAPDLVAWLRVLQRAGVSVEQVRTAPLEELDGVGLLLKTEADLERMRALRTGGSLGRG